MQHGSVQVGYTAHTEKTDAAVHAKIPIHCRADVTEVTPVELLSEDTSIGLPVGLQAPVMTPTAVNSLVIFFSSRADVVV